MATLVDNTTCVASAQAAADTLLPINPFTALQFHFGMLLGVDDLETGQGYPRGKIRLHNAWMHGEGVAWGFKVAFNAGNELTVDPGLGLDAAGHELHLDRQACVDLGAWYGANKDDPDFTFETLASGNVRFTAHVVARFKACLTRPVPAMLEPCAGAQTNTAFSRAFESIDLLLRPGPAPAKPPGSHRLRQLFQLEADDPALADVAVRRATIQALPAVQQPAAWLQALREFAALDGIDRQPQAATASTPASLFPEDPTELVLADVADIVVASDGNGGWALVAPWPVPDPTVRPSLIATATVQELVCGPLFGDAVAAPPPAPSGPTVTQASLSGQSVSLQVSRALAAGTIAPAAFSASDYDDTAGWTAIAVSAAAAQADGSVRVDLAAAPTGSHLRFIARGTGPMPLLAADDLSPLGGAGGTDFVQMFTRS